MLQLEADPRDLPGGDRPLLHRAVIELPDGDQRSPFEGRVPSLADCEPELVGCGGDRIPEDQAVPLGGMPDVHQLGVREDLGQEHLGRYGRRTALGHDGLGLLLRTRDVPAPAVGVEVGAVRDDEGPVLHDHEPAGGLGAPVGQRPVVEFVGGQGEDGESRDVAERPSVLDAQHRPLDETDGVQRGRGCGRDLAGDVAAVLPDGTHSRPQTEMRPAHEPQLLDAVQTVLRRCLRRGTVGPAGQDHAGRFDDREGGPLDRFHPLDLQSDDRDE